MKHFLLTFLISCVLFTAHSQVKLPRLLRDSMVLQRDAKVKIWGWASAGESVTVNFQNKKYRTTADANGQWKIVLPPMNAGGPFTMNI
ncbi:MAG: sialate O-acetylesterase, partial [Segetibacter sp.]